MSKFINPFTDVGFKRIFGQEVNKSLLMEFLNSLLEGEQHIDDNSARSPRTANHILTNGFMF